MARAVVIVSPFKDYVVGQLVTDEDEIDMIVFDEHCYRCVAEINPPDEPTLPLEE